MNKEVVHTFHQYYNFLLEYNKWIRLNAIVEIREYSKAAEMGRLLENKRETFRSNYSEGLRLRTFIKV